ncbi:CvpA family protein [Aerosticca soli]|uniref:Colicin V production protein n=1 Tax=Aerosticca soli TaxID=2010829 RepID=A0A2Z6E4Z1_9GAMM|nr:CvpA family protein [Aerosticca soli]BBD80205.1 colicin V production protein [Aerosticca soli]
MNGIDYLILGVLALSALIGLWRGLVSEVLALATWIAALWLAWLYGPSLAALFGQRIASSALRLAVGYVVCFVLVLIVGALLRFLIVRLVVGTGLGGLDRLLGMLFGLARGVLLVILAIALVGLTAFAHDPWWRQSALLPHFRDTAAWLGQYLPEHVRRRLAFSDDGRPPALDAPATSASARAPFPL